MALGFLLLFWVFKKQNFEDIWGALLQADWKWALIVLSISILNHISRVIRWKLLLKPLGHQPKTTHTFLALMFGYLVSYAIPRLGEISRSAALNKTDQLPFKPIFGTVITERIIDICCL